MIRLHVCYGARCSDRSVHLIWISVCGSHNRRRGRKLLLDVFRVDDQNIARELFAQAAVESLLSWQSRAGAPPYFELASSLDGLGLFLRNHPDEVVANDDLNYSGNLPDRSLVHAGDGSSHLGWPNDTTVKHSRHMYVMHKFKSARHELDGVQRGNRFTQNSPLRGRPPLGGRAQRNVESFASDELLIGDMASSFPCDHAAGHRELIGRLTQVF